MTTELDNDTLEWAAQWIEGSLNGKADRRVREFGKNMAMTLRAAKLPAPVPATGDDEGDSEKRARKIVDDFRYGYPPVQSLRFLEWEPLVTAITAALRSGEES